MTLICVLVSLASSGCRSVAGDTTPATTQAVLDTDNATIKLPIQGYGMSPRETQIAFAASSIVFARCATGKHDVSPTVVQTASEALKAQPPPAEARWLFGFWSADYIATHGWLMTGPGYPTLMEVDITTARRCIQDDAFLAVAPISTSILSYETEFAALTRYSMEAHEKTRQDPRFIRLKSDLEACLRGKGYTADKDSALGNVKLEESWSSEEQLKAVLANARCSDGLRLTQQAGDIDAAYQQEIIKAHEAELTTIKHAADQHVAKAQETLREVGIL
jgi:hypothetical protein